MRCRRPVAVSGAVAYVADGSSGLQVIDVSEPEDPVERVGGLDEAVAMVLRRRGGRGSEAAR